MSVWVPISLGLFGSLHCAGMCGPLALALPRAGNTALTYFGGRLFYNAGRILAYALIGVIFGFAGQVISLAGFQRWLSIAIGSLLLLTLIARLFAPGVSRFAISAFATPIARLKRGLSALLRTRSVSLLGVLGLLNGFLPCGLVYVAAAAAAAAAHPLSGAAFMAWFGLGTVPTMLAISLSGHLIPVSWRLRLNRAVPACMFLLGALLILRGLSLGIPILSPDLADGGIPCCHK